MWFAGAGENGCICGLVSGMVEVLLSGQSTNNSATPTYNQESKQQS